MLSYEIKLQEFTGPLDKLLELIEGRNLEITQISLSEVTADFLKYLETIETNRAEILAEFLPVAAKLLLIKSKAILPNLELTAEEDREIKNFEQQLKEYKRFKEASKFLSELWQQNRISLSREFLSGIQFLNINVIDGQSQNSRFFYPPSNFDLNICEQMLKNIYQEITAFEIPQAELIIKIIDLEEKIKETLSKISANVEYVFSNIAAKNNISDIIVTFLAILHLFKEGKIKLEQSQLFEEIKLRQI